MPISTPIHDFLEEYAKSGTLRLHMPGGKGLTAPFDITEISGADELYACKGIIRKSEMNAARLFGCAYTCYSCGGSTLAIQAMVSAALSVTGKRKIAAGRFSHRSLVDAAILLGADVEWIYPEAFLGCRLSADAVKAAIGDDTAAVFINSVDYLGSAADIAEISRVCRSEGVLLLTDNAHGAYRVFTNDHPITLGADMSADSAHKTLPALTGTAYLHLADERYIDSAKSAMALFGSSSPSYLMLDSLDLCNRYIAEKADEARRTLTRIAELKRELSELGIPLAESDAVRITVDANAMGYSGHGLARLIRERGAECEMGGLGYVVMLLSVIQPGSDLGKIKEIMQSIPLREPKKRAGMPVIGPEKVMTLREAYFSPKEKMPTKSAVGRVCADVCSPCPPCVPIVMPGEVISPEAAEMLVNYGVDIISAVK